MRCAALCLTLCACGSDHLLEAGKYDITMTFERDWVYPPGYVATNVISISSDYHMHNEATGSLDAEGQDLDGVAVFTEHQQFDDPEDSATFKARLTPTQDGFEGEVWQVIELGDVYALTIIQAVGVKR